MEAKSSIHVVERGSTAAQGETPDVVIRELLDEASTDEYAEISDSLRSGGVRTGTGLDLYDLLWKGITHSDDSAGNLVELLVVYRGIADVLTPQTERMICEIETQKYKFPLVDVANAHGVTPLTAEGNRLDEPTRKRGAAVFADMLFSLFVVISLQLVRLPIAFATGARLDSEFVFFPYPGRFESTKPIINAAKFDAAIVVPWLWTNPFAGAREETPFVEPPTSLLSYTSVTAISAQIRFCYSFVLTTFVTRTGQGDLQSFLRAEFGIEARRTVRYAWESACYGRTRGILMGILAGHAYEESTVEGVLVGGNSERERSILQVARRMAIDTYYVHHGVVPPLEKDNLHEPETTVFVEGEFAADYLHANCPAEPLPEVVPLGRPYFEQLLQYRHDGRQSSDDPSLNIVIATQDQSDRIRETFANTVLSALDRVCGSRVETHVVVKIHPSETTALYERLLCERDFSSLDEIEIRSENLYDTLEWADMVVTITSNVGVEAMVLNSICVCVDFWDPFVPVYPYALHPSVPVLESKSRVEEFFRSLDTETMATLRENQASYVSDGYVLSEGMGREIAAYIREDCIASD